MVPSQVSVGVKVGKKVERKTEVAVGLINELKYGATRLDGQVVVKVFGVTYSTPANWIPPFGQFKLNDVWSSAKEVKVVEARD